MPASEGMRHRDVIAGALPGFQNPCCERCGDCRLPACPCAWDMGSVEPVVAGSAGPGACGVVLRAGSEREGRTYAGVSVVCWKPTVSLLGGLLEEKGSVRKCNLCRGEVTG